MIIKRRYKKFISVYITPLKTTICQNGLKNKNSIPPAVITSVNGYNLILKYLERFHSKLKPIFMTTSQNGHKLWKIEISMCKKPLKVATSLNSHKVKELKRLYGTEKPPFMTTSQNGHKWNIKKFISVYFNPLKTTTCMNVFKIYASISVHFLCQEFKVVPFKIKTLFTTTSLTVHILREKGIWIKPLRASTSFNSHNQPKHTTTSENDHNKRKTRNFFLYMLISKNDNA